MTNLSITKDEIMDFVGSSEARPDEVYKLSHAGTEKSGLSVGRMQTDFSTRSDSFQMKFVGSVGLQTSDATTLASELARKGNPSFIKSELAGKVNKYLKSKNGQAFVDGLDTKQVETIANDVADVVHAARSNPRYKTDQEFRNFIDSKAFQAMVATNINQFGPADNLKGYLAGHTEEGIKRQTLNPGTPFNIESFIAYESKYKQVTRSPKGAKLMRDRRQSEFIELANMGMISSIEYQKAMFAADVFYRSTQEVINNPELSAVRSDIANNGFTPTTMIASTRYMQELARPNGTQESALEKAFEGIAEARDYAGPSQENTDEDEYFSKSDMAAALDEARKGVATKVIDGKTGKVIYDEKRDLLAQKPVHIDLSKIRVGNVEDITISNIPKGAYLTAGSNNAPTPAQSALLDGLTAFYGGDREKAETAMWATAPESRSMPNYTRAAKSALAGMNAVRSEDKRSVETDSNAATVAGLMMDKDVAREMMTSGAYRQEHHPQYGFTQAAVKSFYENTYRDNKPETPNRTTALEEPSRKAAVQNMQAQSGPIAADWAAAQRNIDRDRAQQEKQEHTQQKAQAKAEQKTQAAQTREAIREEEGVRATSASKPSLDKQSVLGAAKENLGQSHSTKETFLGGQKQTFHTIGTKQLQEAQVIQRHTTSPPTPNISQSKSKQGNETGPDYSNDYATNNSKGYTGTDKTTKGSVVTPAGNLTQRRDGKANTNDGSPGANSGKVICTELYRQGLLPFEVYAADQRFGQYMAAHDPHVMVGYHAWAKPMVRVMKASPVLSKIIYHGFAKAWAQEMYSRETNKGHGTLWGKVLMAIGIPSCRALGWAIQTLSERELQDHSS